MFIAGTILANSCGSFEYLVQTWTVRHAAILLSLNRFGKLFYGNKELIDAEGLALPFQFCSGSFDRQVFFPTADSEQRMNILYRRWPTILDCK